MIHDRRQFFSTLAAATGVLGLGGVARADDDDDMASVNVFISPCGQPFRAAKGAPYPVVDWFKHADKNGDGKIDHAEFIADAAGFFKILDLNADGFLNSYEVAVYEHRVAPEILGYTVKVGALAPGGRLLSGHDGGRLWRAQMGGPGGGAPAGQIDPNPDPTPTVRKPLPLDESKQGASPFGFFDEPEPVATADFNFNGKITQANFLKLADMHFTTLDPDGRGYLTLDKLPKTAVQRLLMRGHRR
jgi:hypothetical protein